jgi:hypothetical protein
MYQLGRGCCTTIYKTSSEAVKMITPYVGGKNWKLYLGDALERWAARDTDAERACLERGVNAYSAGKYSTRPLPEGCETLL